jgi:NitT/TauT family transport system permease protein
MAKLIMRLTPLAGVLVFLAIWEVVVRILKVPPYLLPPPSEIVRVFVDEFAKIAFHGWVTLYEMLLGYALAVVIAIPLAIAITSSERFDRFTMPTLLFFQVVPKVALQRLRRTDPRDLQVQGRAGHGLR